MDKIEQKRKELEDKIREKQELIVDMELAGCEDTKSQDLYLKTKKQILAFENQLKGFNLGVELASRKVKP